MIQSVSHHSNLGKSMSNELNLVINFYILQGTFNANLMDDIKALLN